MLNFKIIRDLAKNRLQRFSMCGTSQDEEMITEEEIVLGSRDKVLEVGGRFDAFENDEVFLEAALTYLFTQSIMEMKSEYTLEEVMKLVNDAIAQRNTFLRKCAKQFRDSATPQSNTGVIDL